MYDVVFAGGGLASCLAAYRLAQAQPDLEILIVEHGTTLGGNHTWSFFPTDINSSASEWLDPFVGHRWPSYEVRFPGLRRRLNTGYCSMDSARLHEVAASTLGSERLRLGSRIDTLTPTTLTLDDGEHIQARCVIDGRGPESSSRLHLGFQKFTGQVVRLNSPHDLEGPIIMDATVAQDGDYRFVYVLPLAVDQLMIEDTRYSDRPDAAAAGDRNAIASYARASGWDISELVREESGVLPITLGGDIGGFWADAGPTPRIGLRAALFHATTGYSLPDAVRMADELAVLTDWRPEALRRFVESRSVDLWRSQGFLRLLNRMLFLAAEPEQRFRVMERFYRLPEKLIERFYAGAPTWTDRIRILTGKPPVAISAAARCLAESSSARILERQT